MPTRNQKLVQAFQAFDVDGSGTLDKEELRTILARPGMGSTMSAEDIDEIMETFDDDGDGVLSISEFIDLIDGTGGGPEGDDDDGASSSEQETPPPGCDDEGRPADDGKEAADDADTVAPVAAATASWVEFELGVALDQCKSLAPFGTEIDHPMIRDTENNSLVLTMEPAGEFTISQLQAAVIDFSETYSGVTNVARETLPDGYVFTAQNEGAMGTIYWMKAFRTIASKVSVDGSHSQHLRVLPPCCGASLDDCAWCGVRFR